MRRAHGRLVGELGGRSALSDGPHCGSTCLPCSSQVRLRARFSAPTDAVAELSVGCQAVERRGEEVDVERLWQDEAILLVRDHIGCRLRSSS